MQPPSLETAHAIYGGDWAGFFRACTKDAAPFPTIPPLPSATAFRSALREAAARADEQAAEFHESGMTPADEAALPPLDDYADFAALPF